jgi:hypothetical protein
MSTQGHRIDDTAKVDIQGIFIRLLQISVFVNVQVQIVGTRANPSVGEHVIDPSMLVLCCLEEFRKVGPTPDIGLYEKEVALHWGLLDIAAYNECAKGLQQINCGKPDTR